MARKWDRKMILSGIILILIFIRHVVGTYHDGYGPRLSIGINQHQQHQQSIHKHSQNVQHALSPSHPHRHHHEYMHKSNREMHIKSQHSHFYRDRDYRPVTKVSITTAAPTTLSWKWSSATVVKQRFPKLTHINSEGGNETSDGFTDIFKNRLANSERQQWSASNKQIHIGPYRVKINTDDDEPTSTMKTEQKLGLSWWSHNNNHTIQHHDRNSSKPQDNQRILQGKTSRLDASDPGKISHEDQPFKGKTDYHDDYEEDYYYEDDDANGQGFSENKIEERKNRKEKIEDAQIVFEDKVKEKQETEEYGDIVIDDVAEYKIAGKTDGHQQMDDDYISDYVDDEPNPTNEDQNQTISLTEAKWNNYGTAAAVARSRQQYLNSPQSKVDAHIHHIKEEGKCRWPHPKVIPLVDASNRFIPHCTILHRCADDTGCCEDDKKTCTAKQKNSVDLYFYVIPIDNHSKPSIELRRFENHTECQCVDKRQLSTLSNRLRRHNVIRTANVLEYDESCQCPSNFRNILGGKRQCQCDCLKWNQACRELKEGQNSFSYNDQLCISVKKCQKPTCEYGDYSTHSGRCPGFRTSIHLHNKR